MNRYFLCSLLQKLIPITLLFLSGFPGIVLAVETQQKPVNDLSVSNQLRNSPSPYLAIHADDPVAWQEWSPATLELARKQNKLLFVSIGYFSCHWCHVMQAESYRNADIAALVNQNYIPVKYGARSTVVQTTCANGIKFVG